MINEHNMKRKMNWNLFAPQGDWSRNVHLDWNEDYTPNAMAAAFREAADATIARIEERSDHPDAYFYPVAYLYRHYIELELKNIIDCGKQLTPQPFCKTNATGHSLKDLWKDAVAVFDIVFAGDDRQVLLGATEIIEELDRADPDGQSFRYYRNRKGEPYFSELPRVLSLRTFQSQMNKLSAFLEGCACGIDAFGDYQREQLAEMRSEYSDHE
jgi:hypothetical protein